MRAIKINPMNKTVTEIDISGELQDFYDHIECDLIQNVPVGEMFDDYDYDSITVYVDEEGLIKNSEKYFFSPDWYAYPLCGIAIIIGNKDGESCDCTVPIEEVEKSIEWFDENQRITLIRVLERSM